MKWESIVNVGVLIGGAMSFGVFDFVLWTKMHKIAKKFPQSGKVWKNLHINIKYSSRQPHQNIIPILWGARWGARKHARQNKKLEPLCRITSGCLFGSQTRPTTHLFRHRRNRDSYCTTDSMDSLRTKDLLLKGLSTSLVFVFVLVEFVFFVELHNDFN